MRRVRDINRKGLLTKTAARYARGGKVSNKISHLVKKEGYPAKQAVAISLDMDKRNKFAQGGQTTDTVPALLTPGEVVLNAKQQKRLGNVMGQPSSEVFKSIGVPGFAGGGKVKSQKKQKYANILKNKLKRK